MSSRLRAGGRDWRLLVGRLSNSVLSLLFPPVCVNCRQLGAHLCPACLAQVSWLAEPVCPACGRPLAVAAELCQPCRRQPLPLRPIRAAMIYRGPALPLIRQMKYDGYFGLAAPLGDLMAAAWPRWQLAADLLVPIPLHPASQRARGYNQSALLARHLAGRLGRPVEPAALRRVRETRPQVGLGAAERRQNVAGAFVADGRLVDGRHVLLIDDVCTTGATLSAAAVALQQAGAAAVSAFCAARAVGDDDDLAVN